MKLLTSPRALVRSVVVALAVIVVSSMIFSAIRPGGLTILAIVLWLGVIGVAAAGLYLIGVGNRPVAGVGAILTALSIPIAFYWTASPAATIWTLLFLVGVVLVAVGTREDTASAAYWVFLLPRVGVGWALVDNAQDHLHSKWLPGGGGFLQTATGAVQRPPAWFLDPLYQGFLQGAVVPNGDTWAALTICGELTFGLLLALGLLTPVAAVGAMWQNTNYFLMKGFVTHGAYPDKEFFAAELFCLIAGAGLAYGMDAALHARMPAWVVENLMGVSPTRAEPEPSVQPRPGLSPLSPG